MARGQYIPWTREEEQRLPPWLSRHSHLPWTKICEEYARQFGIPRSIHSLRGKLDQLRKGHERQRPISQRASALHFLAARRTRRRGRRFPAVFPASPPPLILKRPDPQIRQLLERMQKLDITRESISDDTWPIAHDLRSFPPQVGHRAGELRLYQYEASDIMLMAPFHITGNSPTDQQFSQSPNPSHNFWHIYNHISRVNSRRR